MKPSLGPATRAGFQPASRLPPASSRWAQDPTMRYCRLKAGKVLRSTVGIRRTTDKEQPTATPVQNKTPGEVQGSNHSPHAPLSIHIASGSGRLTLRGSRTRKHARLRHRLLQAERLEDRQLLATITGAVFNDLNANGLKDTAESGQSGWTVYLDADGNGQLGTDETSATQLPTRRGRKDRGWGRVCESQRSVRIVNDWCLACDNHHQTKVDDLFAQWESNPLQLLSLLDLGM